MNKYRLPKDAYDRKYVKGTTREEIHNKLVGEPVKELIIIDDITNEEQKEPEKR